MIRDPDQRLAVATLSQHADDIENLNPAYRAELRAWTTDDPLRGDGVPNIAVPHVDGSAEDEVPIRDYDTRGTGALPVLTHSPATSASSWSAPPPTPPATGCGQARHSSGSCWRSPGTASWPAR